VNIDKGVRTTHKWREELEADQVDVGGEEVRTPVFKGTEGTHVFDDEAFALGAGALALDAGYFELDKEPLANECEGLTDD
jgi:hypothetical protein